MRLVHGKIFDEFIFIFEQYFFGIFMNYEIVTMPAMTIVGAELHTTYMNNECYSALPAFWEKQRKENSISKIPNKMYQDVLLGIYTDYTPDFSLTSGYFSFIMGVPVTSVEAIPKGMVVKEIMASKYAVFTAKGPFATEIGKKWANIWQNKDFQRSFTHDFEWYDSQSTDDANSIVKIYIALKT